MVERLLEGSKNMTFLIQMLLIYLGSVNQLFSVACLTNFEGPLILADSDKQNEEA